MSKITISAAATGLPGLSRRGFVGGAGLLGIAPVAGAAAPLPIITPHERLDRAIAEVKAAAEALDPAIRDWRGAYDLEPAQGTACRFHLLAFNWRGMDECRALEAAARRKS